MASCVARAPKISTGSDSGSVSSDSSAPLRFTPSVSAAPIEPIRLSATLPSATPPGSRAARRSGAPSDSRRQRRHHHQRQARQQPVRGGLGEQQPGQGLPGQRVLLERAVLGVVAKQELERQQRG